MPTGSSAGPGTGVTGSGSSGGAGTVKEPVPERRSLSPALAKAYHSYFFPGIRPATVALKEVVDNSEITVFFSSPSVQNTNPQAYALGDDNSHSRLTDEPSTVASTETISGARNSSLSFSCEQASRANVRTINEERMENRLISSVFLAIQP